MADDILAPALIQATSRNLSLLDLIRTADTLKSSGQGDAVRSLYATWIQHNGDNPLLYAALFNYAVLLSETGDLARARECLERAIALNNDFMPAYINLGRIYEQQGATGLAIAQWSSVITKLAAINGTAITHKITALNQMARALEAASQDEAAEDLLHQSLDIDNQQREVAQHLLALRQRQCKWPVVVPWERADRALLMRGLSPLSIAAYTDDPVLHLASAYHYNKADVGTFPDTMFDWPKAAAVAGPLKIGYLSSDLREHAVGFLMAEVPGLHDRSAVEVFGYYCGPQAKDSLHTAYKGAVDHWRDISALDDATAARLIAEDGIQILVDVNGYTREGRTKLLARRPAPVIVNWLGFPGTMASPYHHYIVADDWIIPPEDEIYYSEKVLRLPCYQPNNRQRVVSSTPVSRAAAGLPEDAMVYCCFNGAHKITQFTFDRWLTILNQVPGSVLWLLSNSEAAEKRLREYAADHGIAPERLIFAAKLANADHLARYTLADLFLDTTPYGAHTTASDALWMGVPVLTFSGRSFASRVCGSLIRSAGLGELVCTEAADFVAQAVLLGHDRNQLQKYRERLKSTRDSCVLFDTPLLVRELEGLYRQMWADHQAGALPRPDLTNLATYLEVGVETNAEEIEVQTISDYRGWWRQKLTSRHKFRPLDLDHRLFVEPQ